MNNTAEYEALILGMQRDIDLNVAIPKVVGDSKIFIWEVHNTIHCVSAHIRSYQQEVWRLFSHFQAFNTIYVPRMCNIATTSLENATARFSLLRDDFSIEIIYKPSVPNDTTNLHIFYDDQQILWFMVNADVFKNATINEDNNKKALQEAASARKGNLIPKDVVLLEKFYRL